MNTAAKVESAKIEPTDRSMPPPSITTVMPVTTNENSPSWRVEFLQRRQLEEAGDGRAERRDRDDQRQEGNGVVGPALCQQLADDMVGHEIVAPGLPAFAKFIDPASAGFIKRVSVTGACPVTAMAFGKRRLTLPLLRPAAPSDPSSCRA